MRELRQQQQTPHDPEATLVLSGEEATLVTPRFDDEETLVARPVVPLGNGAPPAPAVAPPPAPVKAHAPRRSRMFALVLFSVLVGGVLGGAGLYLYQRQSHDPAVSPAAATQAPEADAAQAPSAPAAEAPASAPPLETTQAEATAAATPAPEEPAAPAAEEPAAAPEAREPERVPAADRREPDAEVRTPKRGKKGARDEESERRRDDDDNLARDDDPGARQVDTIFYRQRRAERRAERRAARRARRAAEDSPDRLRRIFEGSPE